MITLRRFLHAHIALAALIVTAALALRVLVPAGFMPMVVDGRITISICPGYEPVTMRMAMPGMAHHDGGAPKAQGPCAFADLALPATGGVDAIQLAAALRYSFVASLILAVTFAPRAAANLRPPLRGPPRTS